MGEQLLSEILAHMSKRARQMWASSWYNRPVAIRRARLDYIKRLVRMEDEHVAKHGSFGTAAYSFAMHAMILGSPEEMADALMFATLTEKEMGADIVARYDAAFEPLRQLCREMKATLEGEVAAVQRLDEDTEPAQ